MNHQVISSRFPYLPIRLRVREHVYQGDALLDTGFDGGIVMPPNFLPDDEIPDGYITWTLADDSQVSAPAYRGTIELDGLGPFRITVTVLGEEPLVGVQAINRFSVHLDHGERVIVEL